MKRIIITLFLVVGLAGVSQAQTNANQGLMQALMEAIGSATLSDAQVAELSRQAIVEMDAKNPVAAANDPYTVRLNKIVSRHHTISGIPVNYKVYKVADVNAFATADGSVRVFKGLMDIMTDNELLAVMGHEIGHVVNHDTRDGMKSALRRSAVRDAVGSTSGKLGELSRSQLGDIADGLLGAKFSRQQETEADDYSYGFLKRYGYNVLALATSFEKLAKLSGGQGGPTFLSSHPDSQARAQRVRDRARRDGLAR
ncbi:M48 family metallopeptidase [Spirosoma sp. KCTC 42546]|uniref:M48 family metallopeptidase n=1 Tax=Spirosoma sp. KCTC 42546 TaxID=2520506 RepID=UPI00115AEBD0|nr:M48 family metallopeptidase [Spirosoma sp. KCTC 42546]QDK81471.1 M48 family metallopeptidase [Spirosoma sp. KCTC 42546]